jgi:branched-chain amino acid transport system ATP-binding protein
MAALGQNATMNLLSTRGLSRNFGGLKAVSNVDFDLPEGQIRALIGPNGAGKTTFVGMLCGRISASAGEVMFLGDNVTALPAHKRIARGMAYTFQITSIFGRLSLRENVALAVRRRLATDADQVTAEVEDALSRVGLLDRADQIADDLSYGHQRLLEIAMGLGQKPRLLILDEPTQGLADSEIAEFKSLIRSMAGQTTILLIEHNMDVVMEMADFITVLNFGEVLAEGTPEEIHASADVQAAYLGTG